MLAVLASTALHMAAAEPATGNDESVPSRIRALEQELEKLKEALNTQQTKAEARAKQAAVVSIGSGGFAVQSADTNFTLRLRGGFQVDGRFYGDGGTAHDTFLLRRVRPIIEGSVFEKYDYRVMLDFGSGTTSSTANNGFLQDAFLNARLRPEFQIQAGKFKEPVGLERLQSWNNLLFVERGFPTQLVPNRDVGFQLHGELFGGTLNYAAGVFNGVADGGSDDFETADGDKDLAGRLFARPFKDSGVAGLRGLGLGVAGTVGNQEGALRSYATPGSQKFFGWRTGTGASAATANVVADGRLWRIAPQAYYHWGPFGVFGEYVISNQELRREAGGVTRFDVRNTAWQVATSVFLTGESNSWSRVTPSHSFSPANGGWGAWELAARVGQLDVDDGVFPLLANPATSASRATSWGVGLNWHLNRNVKLSLNYEQTDFDGGTTPLLEQGEKVVLTRVQFAF